MSIPHSAFVAEPVSALSTHADRARADLSAARAAVNRRDHEAAARHYRVAIAEVGSRYLHDGITDDTGMKLAIGEGSLSRGSWQEGLTLLDRVLETRLGLLQQRIESGH